MPDCYVCGHPILEGQRSVPMSEIYGEGVLLYKVTHLNSADHLPTLDGGSQMDALEVVVSRRERERAAGLVEEGKGLMYEQIARMVEGRANGSDSKALERYMKQLAQRIREGE